MDIRTTSQTSLNAGRKPVVADDVVRADVLVLVLVLISILVLIGNGSGYV